MIQGPCGPRVLGSGQPIGGCPQILAKRSRKKAVHSFFIYIYIYFRTQFGWKMLIHKQQQWPYTQWIPFTVPCARIEPAIYHEKICTFSTGGNCHTFLTSWLRRCMNLLPIFSMPMYVFKFTWFELVSNGFIAIPFCGLAKGDFALFDPANHANHSIYSNHLWIRVFYFFRRKNRAIWLMLTLTHILHMVLHHHDHFFFLGAFSAPQSLDL